MISRHIRLVILVFLSAIFTAPAQAASPVTGAFGVNLGDRAEAALAQGFVALPDTPNREIGTYAKVDSSAYMPIQTLLVSPDTKIVWKIRAWRPIPDGGEATCSREFYGLLTKLKEKYPTLIEIYSSTGNTFSRTLAERVERIKEANVELADGRYIALECRPSRDERGVTDLMIWYVMDHKERKRYEAESAARRKVVDDAGLKSQGFDAKDF
jgi:hypothetical protein